MCFAPQLRAPAALASLLFDPPGPQIIGKTQCFATFLPFCASASSFFWLFLFSDLLSSTLLFSLPLPSSAFHLSILSEVWLLKNTFHEKHAVARSKWADTMLWKHNIIQENSMLTSSTAQGGGGSFKNRKPIGELGCCESGMAERKTWWTERCLISFSLFLSVSLCFSIFLWLSTYLPTDLSVYLSICLSVCLSPYLSIYLSI